MEDGLPGNDSVGTIPIGLFAGSEDTPEPSPWLEGSGVTDGAADVATGPPGLEEKYGGKVGIEKPPFWAQKLLPSVDTYIRFGSKDRFRSRDRSTAHRIWAGP
jgi:hypothetical protein